jgi:ribosomal protein L11 methyltransferase
VVVANIVSPILLELRGRLSAAVSSGGSLVLSGILATEADDVVLAFCEAGAFVEIARRSSTTDADWVSVTLRRP